MMTGYVTMLILSSSLLPTFAEEDTGEDCFKEAKSSFEILKKFDKDGDDQLNPREFGELCGGLFRNGSMAYPLGKQMVDIPFKIFDANKDGFMGKYEFEVCSSAWIQKIVNPVSALVVVDVQNDFISGSLALKDAPAKQDGKDVIDPINKLVESIPFKLVVYVQDWHPANHISFFENVAKWPIHKSSKIQDPKKAKMMDTVMFTGVGGKPYEQRLWPTHAIEKTWGSELHPDLKIVPNSKHVCKGYDPQVDSNSAFLDNQRMALTPMREYLEEVGATDVYVCGLAYDICAGLTTLDSLNMGFRTVVVEDAMKGVDVKAIEQMKEKILKMGGVIIDSDQVNGMVQGVDRRPELGLHLAKRFQKNKMMASSGNKNEL